MSNSALHEQTLALAGVAKCAILVQDLARQGSIDQQDLSIAVGGLFKFEASTLENVYNGIEWLEPGLVSIRGPFFHPASPVEGEIMRYSLLLIQLARKIRSSSSLGQQLGEDLQAIDTARFNLHHMPDEELLEQLASVYIQCISPVKPKIIVNGEQGYLSRGQTASMVRVCLLCGVRSGFLWLQKGGGRLQLLTGRNRYQNQAAEILGEMV